MKNYQKLITTIALYLTAVLFLFLPFSAWLVSLTGNVWVAALRDVLVAAIFILALFNIKKLKPNFTIWMAILFCVYILLSYFWREASAAQWLKGVRFLILPIVLFLSLSVFNFSKKHKKILLVSILVSAAVTSLFAILEIFHIYIPLTTTLSSAGSLARGSAVGALNIERLQSVLDGPNAYGLYLLALLGFAIAFVRDKKYLVLSILLLSALLILTFSRSVLLGYVTLGLILAVYLMLKSKMNRIWVALVPALIILIFSATAYVVYKNPATRDFVSHHDSTSIRFEQYGRIWDTKGEIGLLGRGTGTAGPSSQGRLDGGPNHFTENIYLDIFEELGYIGLAVYLALIISLIVYSWKKIKEPEGLGAFLLLTSFFFSGFFANYYTGQAGIFLVWLGAGLLLQPRQTE